MNAKFCIALAALLAAGAILKGYGQDKPAPPAATMRLGVVSLAACFDANKVDRVKELDRELQGIADALGPRLQDPDTKERDKARAEYLEFYSRRRREYYAEVGRAVEAVAREGGYGMIFRADSLPENVVGDALSLEIRTRSVLYHPAEVDITADVVKRLNADYAERKKKGKDKNF